jgi:aquaporin related protein
MTDWRVCRNCHVSLSSFLYVNSSASLITGGTNVAYVFGGGGPQNPPTTIYVALSFGFSLLVNAWIFFRISGSLFNPAVSLAMCLVGQVSPVRAVLATIAQFIGGIVAAAMTDALLPGPLNVATILGGIHLCCSSDNRGYEYLPRTLLGNVYDC